MNKETPLERIAEAPALAVERGVEETEKVIAAVRANKPARAVGKFWRMLGPGLTTGAADDDPSGIATYSQAGSQYGFQLLWLAPLTFPLMAVAQEMCARIGLVTGKGLAANIREHFPRWALVTCTALLFLANTLNIGADLGIMAKSFQLIAPSFNTALLVIGFTVLSLALQIFISYNSYAKYLKWLSLVLLTYVATAFVINNPSWGDALHSTVLPTMTFSKNQLLLICAILGTTISPYLFFWQASQEVEEEIKLGWLTIKRRHRGATHKVIRRMRVDNWVGMFFSNLVMFFIIFTTAATLHRAGITTIQSASDAAAVLRPLAGSAASLFFSLGVIGIGLLAIPVLAGGVAYAFSEALHWKEGLYRKLKEAHAFYGVIILATLLGLVMNFLGLDVIKALIAAAVVNGIVAPVILVFIMLIARNKKVMGEAANGRATSFFGWLVTAVMALIGGATLLALVIPS